MEKRLIGSAEAPATMADAYAMIAALERAFDEAATALADAKGGYSEEWVGPMESRVVRSVKGTVTEGVDETSDAEATRKALAFLDLLFRRLRQRAS